MQKLIALLRAFYAPRISDIEPNFTCTRCGHRGAEVRPKFSQARMGTG